MCSSELSSVQRSTPCDMGKHSQANQKLISHKAPLSNIHAPASEQKAVYRMAKADEQERSLMRPPHPMVHAAGKGSLDPASAKRFPACSFHWGGSRERRSPRTRLREGACSGARTSLPHGGVCCRGRTWPDHLLCFLLCLL